LNPSAMGNSMLYENMTAAEFSRKIAHEFGMQPVEGHEAYIRDLNFCTYRLEDGTSAEATAKAIRLKYPSSVRYVQYNQIFRALYSPNDPRWTDSTLWGISQLGAETAWDTAQGLGVRVAVLDTGIRETHEDLAWTAIPGVNLDLIHNDEIPEDEYGHGTHVCGTVAATGNNSKGVIGAAFEAELLPIKVLNSSGYSTSGSISAGIALATANKADIINLSLGSYSADRATFEASLDAWNQGVLVVAAAGNDNINYAHYPSAYPQVISVGASTRGGSKANYSNWGDTLDIAAPGGQSTQIYSTTRNSFTSYGKYERNEHG